MTAIVADIRNKIAGSVFSKNRYGPYIRTKVTPVNPSTTAQQTVRNRLATNSQAWRSLTQAQRDSWISAAPNFPFTDIFGNAKILSGQALYVKLNNNLAITGTAPIATAPAPIAVPALDSIVGDVVSTTAISFEYAPTPVPADFALIVVATPSVSPGKAFVKNLFRNVTAIAAAAASPQNLFSAYVAVHGIPVLGQKVFIKAFYISTTTGQAGIPLQTVNIVS